MNLNRPPLPPQSINDSSSKHTHKVMQQSRESEWVWEQTLFATTLWGPLSSYQLLFDYFSHSTVSLADGRDFVCSFVVNWRRRRRRSVCGVAAWLCFTLWCCSVHAFLFIDALSRGSSNNQLLPILFILRLLEKIFVTYFFAVVPSPCLRHQFSATTKKKPKTTKKKQLMMKKKMFLWKQQQWQEKYQKIIRKTTDFHRVFLGFYLRVCRWTWTLCKCVCVFCEYFENIGSRVTDKHMLMPACCVVVAVVVRFAVRALMLSFHVVESVWLFLLVLLLLFCCIFYLSNTPVCCYKTASPEVLPIVVVVLTYVRCRCHRCRIVLRCVLQSQQRANCVLELLLLLCFVVVLCCSLWHIVCIIKLWRAVPSLYGFPRSPTPLIVDRRQIKTTTLP